MRFLGILLATLFTGLFISLFASSSVNAQSTHGILTSELMLEYNESCEIPSVNISTNWLNFFTQPGWVASNGQPGVYDTSGGQYLDKLTELREGIQNDSIDWGVYVLPDGGEGYNFYTLVYAPKGEFYNYLNYNPGLDNVITNYFSRYNDSRLNIIDIRQPSDCGVYEVTSTSDNASWEAPLGQYYKIFLNNFIYDYSQSAPGYDDPENPPIPDTYDFPTKTPVWLNYRVKFIEGEKMTIQSDNWTNYRDKHGGGIRYGDVGGTSDITLCRIEDKDNTGCVETLAYIEDRSGPITLEYPKTLIGQVGYYKVFIDNTNKEPKIPPFDLADYPFDVKNRSIIVFNDGVSTTAVDTIGYYENEPYFPQYDDNVYYNKFMNHDLVDDHGLLNVVLAPIGYLSQLPDVTCQPLNLPMPARFGEDISLPCMTESVYQPQFPELFQMYQLLITAVFSYMVGLRLFQNIKEMSSEKDDSIEVVKL